MMLKTNDNYQLKKKTYQRFNPQPQDRDPLNKIEVLRIEINPNFYRYPGQKLTHMTHTPTLSYSTLHFQELSTRNFKVHPKRSFIETWLFLVP